MGTSLGICSDEVFHSFPFSELVIGSIHPGTFEVSMLSTSQSGADGRLHPVWQPHADRKCPRGSDKIPLPGRPGWLREGWIPEISISISREVQDMVGICWNMLVGLWYVHSPISQHNFYNSIHIRSVVSSILNMFQPYDWDDNSKWGAYSLHSVEITNQMPYCCLKPADSISWNIRWTTTDQKV